MAYFEKEFDAKGQADLDGNSPASEQETVTEALEQEQVDPRGSKLHISVYAPGVKPNTAESAAIERALSKSITDVLKNFKLEKISDSGVVPGPSSLGEAVSDEIEQAADFQQVGVDMGDLGDPESVDAMSVMASALRSLFESLSDDEGDREYEDGESDLSYTPKRLRRIMNELASKYDVPRALNELRTDEDSAGIDMAKSCIASMRRQLPDGSPDDILRAVANQVVSLSAILSELTAGLAGEFLARRNLGEDAFSLQEFYVRQYRESLCKFLQRKDLEPYRLQAEEQPEEAASAEPATS
jgi:hypothetical protein